MNTEKREPYKNNSVLTYQDLENFFIPELELEYYKGQDIPKVDDKYNEYRVWLLFAKFENWVCMQVAHSKNDVKKEIEFVLECLSQKCGSNNYELKDSQFFKNVCPKPKQGENYRKLLYTKIGSESKEFKICILDVNNYLGLEKNEGTNNNDADRIIEICKNQYAEAKIAYQTLAVYWRKVSSAIDGQTISYAVEHRSEFE